ncbi:recombinase family protein [Streptomyces sp. MRC013]|uniref:recombinase family protein n=1 Tax=Streptomyces sp. MRC013 TaxID=2898276 RepID=UPI0032E9C4D7
MRCPRRDVTRIYEGNDLSAYKHTTVRPESWQMLEDLKVGWIDGVVVWDIDRFTRRSREPEARVHEYGDAERGSTTSSSTPSPRRTSTSPRRAAGSSHGSRSPLSTSPRRAPHDVRRASTWGRRRRVGSPAAGHRTDGTAGAAGRWLRKKSTISVRR